MTAPVCTTQQFDTPGGILALSPSALGSVVARTVVFSTADGQINAPLTSTGKLMLDARAHWTSTYKTPVTVLPIVQRRRCTYRAAYGNTIFTRERYTTAVGVDSSSQVLAPEPTTDPVWDTEAGGGVIGDGTAGTLYLSYPESCALLAPLTVAVGQSCDVRYRMTGFTAYTGGSWDAGRNEIYVFYLTVMLLVLPTALGA